MQTETTINKNKPTKKSEKNYKIDKLKTLLI